MTGSVSALERFSNNLKKVQLVQLDVCARFDKMDQSLLILDKSNDANIKLTETYHLPDGIYLTR